MPQTFNVGSRSLFVTFTAWMFIGVAVLASLSALVQSAEIASVLPQWRIDGAGAPRVTGWLLAYLPWVAGAAVAVSFALLACAVGLLMRFEWARRTAIGLLGLVIALNLAGLWLQHELVQALFQQALQRTALPPQAADVFGGFATAAQLLAVAITVGACALLGWAMQRLRSEAVRQEFA